MSPVQNKSDICIWNCHHKSCSVLEWKKKPVTKSTVSAAVDLPCDFIRPTSACCKLIEMMLANHKFCYQSCQKISSGGGGEVVRTIGNCPPFNFRMKCMCNMTPAAEKRLMGYFLLRLKQHLQVIQLQRKSYPDYWALWSFPWWLVIEVREPMCLAKRGTALGSAFAWEIFQKCMQPLWLWICENLPNRLSPEKHTYTSRCRFPPKGWHYPCDQGSWKARNTTWY